MAHLSDEVWKAAMTQGIKAQHLPPVAAESVRLQLQQRFGLDSKTMVLTARTESLHHPDAWSWISSLIGPSQAILLFLPHQDPDGWVFSSGSDLVAVLADCTGFPFFVTSFHVEYLLAFNDEDCLIGAGTAADWVRSRGEID